MFKGLGDMGDLSKMMEAAQQMQSKMTEMQEGLTRLTVTGESGGGLVKATATAKGELTALDIDPSIFKAEDKEVVEDLILAAIRTRAAPGAGQGRRGNGPADARPGPARRHEDAVLTWRRTPAAPATRSRR